LLDEQGEIGGAKARAPDHQPYECLHQLAEKGQSRLRLVEHRPKPDPDPLQKTWREDLAPVPVSFGCPPRQVQEAAHTGWQTIGIDSQAPRFGLVGKPEQEEDQAAVPAAEIGVLQVYPLDDIPFGGARRGDVRDRVTQGPIPLHGDDQFAVAQQPDADAVIPLSVLFQHRFGPFSGLETEQVEGKAKVQMPKACLFTGLFRSPLSRSAFQRILSWISLGVVGNAKALRRGISEYRGSPTRG